MTDTFEAPAVETVAVPPVTDAPEASPATPTEETTQAETPEVPEFTRKQHEAAIQAAKAKLERKYEREYRQRLESENAALRQTNAPKPVETAGKPNREDFSGNDVAYIEALADWTADRKMDVKLQQWNEQSSKNQQQRFVESAVKTFQERAAELRKTNPDYDELIQNEDLNITPRMATAISLSESGPKLALYLAKNPGEADRIASLHPDLAGVELGRLEARISAPTAKIASTAPAPTRPGSTTRQIVSDFEKMSQGDFEKQMKKAGSRYVR